MSLAESLKAAAKPAKAPHRFSYDEAFERNLGWFTPGEQLLLRSKRIAICGLGGVGGSHLLTLARLGIGAFSVADFDQFELANMNRQAGATMSSLGCPKAETLVRMARDINPELDLRIFAEGVNEANLDQFLDGVDVYVDSLDFFVLDLRGKLYSRCRELGIPVVCAAPIGMGVGYLVFTHDGMSFEDWFRLSGLTADRQRVNFLLGLAPRSFQRSYVADISRVDLARQRGPSTAIACELCAGVAGAEVVKLLLQRGSVRAVPWYHQFDPYRGKFVSRRLNGGNRNPLQRLKLQLAYRMSERLSRNAIPLSPRPTTEIESLIEKARWAPSGDNVQPWQFEIIAQDHVVVHVVPKSGIYDYGNGTPTLLAAGFLLESLRLAASECGRSCEWTYFGRNENGHQIDVRLLRSAQVTPDRLSAYLSVRSVDRRAYRLSRLSQEQKQVLTATLGPAFDLKWHETARERWDASCLNALATELRLRIPEAFAVHQEVVDCAGSFSQTGIPMTALGLDPVSRRLLMWGLANWRRMNAMNTLGATLLARVEMDLLPGLLCGAHFTVRHRLASVDTPRPEYLLQCGEMLQRFWLKATELGFAVQPSLAPLCFAYYGRQGHGFTGARHALARSRLLVEKLDAMTDGNGARTLFMGRIGEPRSRKIVARSIRRPYDQLIR